MKKVSLFALVATLALGVTLSVPVLAEDTAGSADQTSVQTDHSNMSTSQDQGTATSEDERIQQVQNDSGAN